MKSREKR